MINNNCFSAELAFCGVNNLSMKKKSDHTRCYMLYKFLQISCKVRIYYNPKGPPGPSSVASEKFFAGVQV